MPVLRYWDEQRAAYVDLIGSGPPGADGPEGPPGAVYADVAAAPPDPSTPVIAPPNGYLWVDTTDGAGGTSTNPYYPPQPPPTTGINKFIDPSGEVWLSRDGSAWKRARDVAFGKMHTDVAINLANAGPVGYGFTVIDYDGFGCCNLWDGTAGRFTCPVDGVYHADGRGYAAWPAGTVAGPFFIELHRNTTVIARGNQFVLTPTGDWVSQVNDDVACVAGDTLSLWWLQFGGVTASMPAGYLELNTFAVHLVAAT